MSSGFSGGGDFYNATGFTTRSLTSTAMNTTASTATNNNNLSQFPYRSQLPGLFLDPSSQIAHRASSLIGKRTLMEFQTNQQQQQQQNQNNGLNGLFLRSVKPRLYNHTSPISPLSPFDFSANLSPEVSALSSSSALLQQRFGVPLLQQLRPQQITLGNGTVNSNNATSLSGISYMNTPVQNRVLNQESDTKMMNRLQELEKQLLDDNDEDEGDAVSVITNSEWSETIQNLISPSQKPQKPISTSPTSSSSSSSSSVASAASSCSKQSIMEAASAISEGKSDIASEILSRLGQISNPLGNSEQRLIECMIFALKSRLNPVENPPPVAELYSKEHVVSTQLLYDLSPCFKLGFMAANLAILEATLEQPEINKLHVLDFDIGQGGQYMNLLHALSARQNGKPALVKITAVADHGNGGEEKLKGVGDMLRQLAEGLGVCLEFKVVTQKLTELTRDSLGCEPDEPLAVNFAFKLYRMPDESVSTENPRDELLRLVKGLSPRVVTLVEQEMNANTAPFMARVGEVRAYYGALFDSIESTVQRDNSDRLKVEAGLSRKLGNSVACEGRERVERCEVFGKWRARMGMAGFALKPLSQNVAESMRARLSSGSRVNPGFTVKEENGGVCFGWMGKTLTVASAWR